MLHIKYAPNEKHTHTRAETQTHTLCKSAEQFIYHRTPGNHHRTQWQYHKNCWNQFIAVFFLNHSLVWFAMPSYHVILFFPFYHGIAINSFIHHWLFARTFTPPPRLCFPIPLKWHSILPILLLLLFRFKFNFYRYLMSFVAEPCWHAVCTHRWWSHSSVGSFFGSCPHSHSTFVPSSLNLFAQHTFVRQCTCQNASLLFKGYALPSIWYDP